MGIITLIKVIRVMIQLIDMIPHVCGVFEFQTILFALIRIIIVSDFVMIVQSI